MVNTVKHPALEQTRQGSDPARPLYHFTPAANWINDPNGLVYYAGEYHLFYQYHPDSTLWGPMHWGHAVSTDLVDWQQLPIALYPDALGMIFSGSAVIDWHNTAGFGKEAMIAIFTHHSAQGQSQSLAYSTDKGRTWTKYTGNPVIAAPPDEKDFRDPKVFWVANADNSGHWVMLLAVADSIWFYTLPNLTDWSFTGEFGEGDGSHAGVWETPDLFKLAVDNRPETRWVLTVGVGAGADVTEQGTQYFVGHFDGAMFTSENPPEMSLRADHGPDFYAAQGWNDARDNQPLWIAWMSNWIYAREIPTGAWRGTMTLPRALGLRTTAAGLRLVQQPLAALQQRRNEHWFWQNELITPENQLVDEVRGATFEIVAEFQVNHATTAASFGLRVRIGDHQATTIGYRAQQQQLFVDRAASGQLDFNGHFGAVYRAPLAPMDDMLRLHIFVDHCSVEVFGNDGLASITALIFPDPGSVGIEVFAEQGQVALTRLDIYRLLGAYHPVARQ